MALDDKDIFIVNREVNGVPNGWKTYKTDAQSIGEYLFTAPMPPGVIGDNGQNNFVNDGPLNVEGYDGTAAVPWKGSRETHNLHSANEYQVGTLNFLDGFWVTSNGGCPHPVNVGIDMFWVSKNLPCSSDNTIVSDPDTDCIYIDYNNLTENIVCGTGGVGGGLDGSSNCLTINLCAHSGLTFSNPNGCLEVLLCPDFIIHHPSNGCLTLDLEELTLALTCGGGSDKGNCAGGGLMPHPNTGDCIVVDFEYVAHNIICGRNCNNGAGYGGLDVGSNGKCLIVDTEWVVDQHDCHPSINLVGGCLQVDTEWVIDQHDCHASIDLTGGCLQVNQGWLQGEIQNYVDCTYIEGLGCDLGGDSGDGLTIKDIENIIDGRVDCDFIDNLGCSGTGTPTPTPTIDCDFVLSCQPDEPDVNECSVLSNIWGYKLVLKESGTGQKPAIAWGTKDTSGIYMGMGGSTKDRRIRYVSDKGWKDNDCGGEPSTGKAEIYAVQLGEAGSDSNNFKNWTNRYFKPRSAKQKTGEQTAMFINAGTDDGDSNMHAIELVYETTRTIDNSEILSEIDDSRLASLDTEAALDAILDADTDNLISTGLLKWGREKAENLQYVSEDFINNIVPFLDVEQVAAIHPLLAVYGYTRDSYYSVEEEDGSTQRKLKENPAERTLKPLRLNDNILTFLLIARARKQKARIAQLETQMADVLSRLDAAGI